jgi:uncharacterized membrane protein
MNQAWISKFPLRKRALAGLFAPLAIVASSASGAAGQAAPTATAAQACTSCLYSVINLDPEGAISLLNENGQAAFASFVYDTHGFFDGDRVRDLGTLGGNFTAIHGLNNRGVVVGESLDNSQPFPQIHAFSWTAAGGMRRLPKSLGASAYAINDRNQIAGAMPASGDTTRAVRWDPDGSIRNLGPLPLSLSEARTINEQGATGGYTDVADGTIHAAVWDPAGRLTDLGTLGGERAFTEFINERGEAAGYSDNATNDRELVFFWSARRGLVPIGAEGAGIRRDADLNDLGEVVGNTDIGDSSWAYLWSRSRGLVLLPRGGGVRTDVFDVNNRTEMVGLVERANGDTRAVRWNGPSNPVDLNTKLYRPPAGLVLYAASNINDAGVILAYSNAGLVMLRPGTRGTDAPVLGPVTGLPDEVSLGQDVRLSLGFVDSSASQTHKAGASWEDGCASPQPQVHESGGVGEVTLRHRFCKPGYYLLTVKVTDSGGRTTETRRYVSVNDPTAPTVSGQGTLARAPEGKSRALPVRFALWAPVGKNPAAAASGAEAGAPCFRLSGAIQFRSGQVGMPAVSGQQVRLEGNGRLNGRPGYRFLVEAADSGRQAGGDRMRVRVTHTDNAGVEVVDYDNGAPVKAAALAKVSAVAAADSTLVVDGGVTLHN